MNNLMEIEHLNKRFGDIQAVRDLSFRVKEGELFAFLGVNGAGKSTTINILCGQAAEDTGTVRLGGPGGLFVGALHGPIVHLALLPRQTLAQRKAAGEKQTTGSQQQSADRRRSSVANVSPLSPALGHLFAY